MKVIPRLVRALALTALLCGVGVCAGGGGTRAHGEARTNTKYPQQVLLIRHAEKTGAATDPHLSNRGQERAALLDQLFKASKNRPVPFPTPDFIFAARNKNNSRRPLETVTPLAGKLKLAVNSKYHSTLTILSLDDEKAKQAAREGMLGLRDDIFGDAKYFGKTILVSWRHSTICELAKTLKATKVPAKWEDNVFDRVWRIGYDDLGNATFRDLPQRLLPGDTEK